jgi:D-alanine transaminase
MDIAYFNRDFVPKEEIRISPDDRGFLFADGVYEVVRWYEGSFYDMPGHLNRLKRSMRELRLSWPDVELFPTICEELIRRNNLQKKPSMVYLQVTRGMAKRTHYFPSPAVPPTVYLNAWSFNPDHESKATGIKVMLKEDIRWSRCDIKSVALLANTLSFQEATENGLKECIFVRNGNITEGSHSNIFFVINNVLYTHPESCYILSGISRKNVLRLAEEAGIAVREEALAENRLRIAQEAFITNTSAEVTPVTEIGGNTIGNGLPGSVTRLLSEKFNAETTLLKGKE